jgi:Glycosyl transferases group 1
MSSLVNESIQLVAFAAPFPPDYGGVMDVYFKISALKEIGVNVHLHAFTYKQHQPSVELNRICASVQYYPRMITAHYMKGWPYVVATRYNTNLLKNVLQIGYPVLLEALHTSWLIPHLREAKIQHALRLHNVEWMYYRFLAEQEASFTKRRYFIEESARLKNFEKVLSKSKVFTLSALDTRYIEHEYPMAKVTEIMPFHTQAKMDVHLGKGDFAIFHGNLSVNENELAALWLIQEVFSQSAYPLVIAGKDPSEKLVRAVSAYRHIRLVANPDESVMQQLLHQAHVHVLPNRQPTGMKLKWANAMHTARFIIAHPDMSNKGNPIAGVYCATQPQDYIQCLETLKNKVCDSSIIENRVAMLGKNWDNISNAGKLLEGLLG